MDTFSGGFTLTSGTTIVGAAAALGNVAGTLHLNGGALDLAINSSVSAYPTVVGGNTTIFSDAASAGHDGVSHTLGSLSIGADTLTVNKGANVTVVSSVPRVQFGAWTLTGNATFDSEGGSLILLGNASSTLSGNFNTTFQSQDGTGLFSIRGTSVNGAPRTSGVTTLSSGTLSLNTVTAGVPAVILGTVGASNTLVLNGGTLDLQMDASIGAYNTTIGGNVDIQSDSNALATGNTQTFGTLSMGANTLTVSAGGHDSSGTATVQFGATTLTGNPIFNVTNTGNAGTTVSQLTLGALNDGGAVARTITKNGNATLALGAAATSLIAGTKVIVSSGTLNSNNATALGSLAQVDVADGATFGVGASQTISALTDSTTATHTAAVSIGNGFVLSVGGTDNLSSTFSRVISGQGGLTKSGTGTLTLSGANTYTGATLLSGAGTLSLTGTLSGSNVTVNNAAGLFSESSTGVIAGAASTFTLTTGTATLAGVNTYGGLTTVTLGTLTLTGSNTSAGATTLTGGALQLNNASNGGLASGLLTLNGGALQSILASQGLSNAVTLSAGSVVSGANSITLNGAFSQSASSTLTNNITGANSLTLANNVNIDAVTGTPLTLTLAGSGTTNISSTIQDFSGGTGTSHGSLTVNSTGTVILAGSNSFAGTATLTAGTLQLTNTAAVAHAAVQLNGGTLSLLSNASASFTTAGAIAVGINDTATINVDHLTAGTNQTITLSGASFTVSGNSPNTETLNVTGGSDGYTLQIPTVAVPGAIGLATFNANGANLGITTLNNPDASHPDTLTFGGSGNITVGNDTSGGATNFIADNSSGTVTFNGVSAIGNGAVTQSGPGTLILAGISAHTGATTVNAGTLSLTGSLTGATAVAVNSGTLSETTAGSIGSAAATVTVSGGLATLAGVNSYTGATNMSGGTLNLTGTLSGGGAVTLNGGTFNLTGGLITGPSAITLNGGTFNLTGGSITGASAIAVNTGGTFAEDGNSVIGSAAATLTVSGGSVTLAGANTYTGATAVNNGTLQLNNSTATPNVLLGTDALTLGGGTLKVNGNSVATFVTQTVGTFTLTAATSSAILLSDTNTTTGTSLTTTGALATPASGTVLYLNRANGGNLTLGTTTAAAFSPWAVVTDATATGFGSVNASHQLVRDAAVTALTASSNASATDFTTNPSTDPAYSGGTLTMAAGTHALNSLFIDGNTTTSGTLALNGQTISLASNALGMGGTNSFTISGAGGITAATNASTLIVTSVGTGTLAVDSLINAAGASGLTKAGSGTVALGAVTQTYTGTTTVEGGTLQLATGGSLPAAGAVSISNPGTFDINGFSPTLTGALTNNGTITNSSGTPATFTEDTSAGNKTIAGAGSYAGNMNVVLSNGSAASSNSSNFTNSGNVTIKAGSTGAVTLSGGINNTGTVTNAGTGAASTTISGVIGANVASVIENSNTSELFLSAVNSYGALLVKSGTVSVATNSTGAGVGSITLGDTAGSNSATFVSTINGGSFSNPIVVATNANAGTLSIGATTNGQTFTGGVTGVNNITLVNNGAGILTFSGGAINNTGNVTIADNSTGQIALSAPINNGGLIINSGSGTQSAANIPTISGIIGSLVTGVIQNSATSPLTISGDFNTYASTTKVLNGALIWGGAPVAGNTPLGTGVVQVGDVSGVNSALLVPGLGGNGGGTLGNAINVPSGSAGGALIGELGGGNTSGGFTYSGTITLNRNVTLGNGLTGGGGGFFSGNIVDAAGTANTVSLVSANGGVSGDVVQNFSGAGNTWGGGTIVDGGVWAVSSAATSLGTGGVTVNGGELRLSGTGNIASGKTVQVNSGGMLSVTGIFNPTSLISANSSGALGLDVTGFNIALNMASIGNGSMFLGGDTNPATYTATTLGVGSGNTYRLGAGGGNSLVSGLTISGTNVLTGGAAVVIGSTLANVPYVKGNGWITLTGSNNYTGGTTINFASVLDASLLTGTGTVLGSNTAAVRLNGGNLQLASNAAATSTTIGALNFNGSSALTFNTATSATNAFTVGSLARINNGTLLISDVTTAAALGGVAQVYSTVAPATDTTGLTAAYYYDPGTNNFLTYGAVGFTDIATATSLTSGSNVKLSATTSMTANAAVNSLVLAAPLSSNASGPWTLTVGNSGSTAGLSFAASQTFGSATAANNINITFGSTGTAEGIIYAAVGTTNFDALITTTGGITKSGPGILNLSPTGGVNTFTGQVTIEQGTVTVSADGAFGNINNVVLINGGTLALNSNASLSNAARVISIGSNGATIQTVAPNNASADTIASQITGSAPFLVFNTQSTNANPSYVFTLTNTGNNFTAPIYIDQIFDVTGFTLSIGADSEFGNAANSVNISAGATLQTTASISTTRTFNLSNQGGTFDVTSTAGAANKYTIGGVISGDGNLTKVSSGGLATGGILELTAANTLTGNTVVTGGSVLLGNALALQNSTVGVGVNGGLTFDPSITTFTIGGLGGSGNVALSDTTGASVTLAVGNDNQNINYSGVLSGSGGLTKLGTGIQTLSGANTYTGATRVQGGGTLLNANSAGALPAASALTIGGADNTAGTFDLGGFAQTVASLNSSGTAGSANIVTNSGASNATFTVSGGGTFAGNIKDGASKTTALAITGGIMSLTGNNSFSGGATVSGGTLLVSGSLSGSGAVNVGAGATLGGSGMIAGATSVTGTLNPGSGLAATTTLAINNNVAFNDGSTFEVNIDSANNLADELTIGGTSSNLALNGTDTLTFALVNGASLANLASGTYIIATYTGSLTGGQFATDATLQPNWSISYATPDQVDLVVGAIPEPGTCASLLGGVALLALWGRKRRSLANPLTK